MGSRYNCWWIGPGNDKARGSSNRNRPGDAAPGNIEHLHLATAERDKAKLSIVRDSDRLGRTMHVNNLSWLARHHPGTAQHRSEHIYLVAPLIGNIDLSGDCVIIH